MNNDSKIRRGSEREIDLAALLNAVFRKWRLLLILALLFAVLGALYNYRSQKKNIAAAKEAAREAAEAEAQTTNGTAAIPSPESLTQLGDISSLKEKILRTIDKKLAYLDQTELSGLDPLAEARSHFEIAVTFDALEQADTVHEVQVGLPDGLTEEEAEEAAKEALTVTDYNDLDAADRKAQSLLSFYVFRINYVMRMEEAAEVLEVDPAFARELYSASTDSSRLFAVVNVAASSEERAKLLADEIINELREAKKEAVELYGEHELLIYNRSTMMILNQTRTTWLNERMSEINALMNNYNSLTANEEKIRTAGQQLIEEMDITPGPTSLSRRALVKYAAVGFIGGAVLSAFLIALYLVLKGVVISGRDLNTQYGLRKLAVLPPEGIASLHGLDRKLAEANLCYASNRDPEKCYAMANENIRVLLGENRDVALVGDLPSDKMDMLVASLNAAGEGIRYHMLSDISEPAMLKELDACDGAVLVAGTMQSGYRKINDLLGTLEDSGRKVLGSIVI